MSACSSHHNPHPRSPSMTRRNVLDDFKRLQHLYYELKIAHQNTLEELHNSRQRSMRLRHERNLLIERIIELEDQFLNGSDPSRRTDHGRARKRPFDADEPSDFDDTPPRKVLRHSQHSSGPHILVPPPHPSQSLPFRPSHFESTRRSTSPPATRHTELPSIDACNPHMSEQQVSSRYAQAPSSSVRTRLPSPPSIADSQWGPVQRDNLSPSASYQPEIPGRSPEHANTKRIGSRRPSSTSQSEGMPAFSSKPGAMQVSFSRGLSPSPFQSNLAQSRLNDSGDVSEGSRGASSSSPHSESRVKLSTQHEHAQAQVARMETKPSASAMFSAYRSPMVESLPSIRDSPPTEGSESGGHASHISSPALPPSAASRPSTSSMPAPAESARLLFSRALSPSPFCP